MRFRILGPIEARDDAGVVALGGAKPRALLAVLLLHPNHPVSSDRLALALWGDESPGEAVKTVRVHMSRLRKALGDPGVVATTPGGYRLRVLPGELDSDLFESLADEGRAALASGQPAQAATLLRRALSLWRGPALADFADEPFAAGEIARLEEQRLAALESRFAADLRAGRHSELVGELRRVVADHPTRERFVAQLMLALYRSGRQVDALEAYTQARRVLTTELGVEPGLELRHMQESILHHDAALAPPATASPSAPSRTGDDVGLRRGSAPLACPFKGLAAFDLSDAQYFCGRDRLVRRLADLLAGARLVGVLGPSGSGKSSLVRAGLLPALADGALPGSEDWIQVLIRPGEHPLSQLDVATRSHPGQRTVVIVDQFEEIFTVCEDEHERQAFVEALVGMTCDRDGDRAVVLAIRADFYGRCAAYPQLADLVAASHMLVGPMRSDELHEAIVRPSQRAGLQLPPELVEALLHDVHGEPGALPLLSATLLELWRRREGRHLTIAAYDRMGGVRGAVSRLAEDAFGHLRQEQQLVARSVLMRLVDERTPGRIERRRVLLLEMQTLQGRDVARILALFTDRRLLTVSAGAIELAHEAVLREWPRLQGWIEQDRDAIRLQRTLNAAAQDWLTVDRDDGALYRGAQLVQASAWITADKPTLNELEREFMAASEARERADQTSRRRRTALGIAGAFTVLLAISVVAVVAVSSSRETQLQRDIAASHDLAARAASTVESDPGLSRRIALAAYARHATADAELAVRQATLADTVMAVLRTKAGAINAVAPSADGRLVATGADGSTQIWDVRRRRIVSTIPGHRGPVRSVAFSPDARSVATAGLDGDVAIADVNGRRRRVVLKVPPGAPPEIATPSVEFSSDARRLVIQGRDGTLRLIDVAKGTSRLLGRVGPGSAVARFNHAGTKVVAGFAAGVRIWDIATGRSTSLVISGGADVVASAFSPSGRRLATVDVSGRLRIWDPGNGRLLSIADDEPESLTSLRFSADGGQLVTAARDGLVRVYDTRDLTRVGVLRAHGGAPVSDAAVARGGEIVSGGADGALRVWAPVLTRALEPEMAPESNVSVGRQFVTWGGVSAIYRWAYETGRVSRIPRASRSGALGTRTSEAGDGSTLAVSSFRGIVHRINVRTGQARAAADDADAHAALAVDRTGRRVAFDGAASPIIQTADGGRVVVRGQAGDAQALAFSPDGSRLVTASTKGIAQIFDATTGTLMRSFRGHVGAVNSVDYDAHGTRIVTAASDASIRIWPVRGGAPLVLYGHRGAAASAAFNPRGDRILSAGVDGTVRIWDAETGTQLVVLQRYDAPAEAAFTTDGRHVVSTDRRSIHVAPCSVCGSFGDVLKIARSRAPERLSQAERQQLLTNAG